MNITDSELQANVIMLASEALSVLTQLLNAMMPTDIPTADEATAATTISAEPAATAAVSAEPAIATSVPDEPAATTVSAEPSVATTVPDAASANATPDECCRAGASDLFSTLCSQLPSPLPSPLRPDGLAAPVLHIRHPDGLCPAYSAHAGAPPLSIHRHFRRLPSTLRPRHPPLTGRAHST